MLLAKLYGYSYVPWDLSVKEKSQYIYFAATVHACKTMALVHLLHFLEPDTYIKLCIVCIN